MRPHAILRLACVLICALSLGQFFPQVASAVEFTMGGQITLFTTWDSTQINGNEDEFVLRNNSSTFQHGRFFMSTEKTRMYFIIKGPRLWGARSTGFIEWDFDEKAKQSGGTGLSYSINKQRLGLRHAFFRLDWPETELLMGQYWSLLTEDIPDVASPGTAALHGGNPYFREPQVRLSQRFLNYFLFSVSVSEPMNGQGGTTVVPDQANIANNQYTGESSETPRLSARLRYEQDLWGKAPYFGAPRAFTFRFASSWQRSRFRPFTGPGIRFGSNNYVNLPAVTQRDQQYLNHWITEASIFIPIIPTYTKELAHTLAFLTQWYVGAGLDAMIEDVPASSSYLDLIRGTTRGDRQLLQKFGGFAELQYYLTGSWYMNAVYGMNRAFNVDLDRWAGTTTSADPVKLSQQMYLALWYRPAEALKFGLEYSYIRTIYFQKTTVGSRITDLGENHRLLFACFFYF